MAELVSWSMMFWDLCALGKLLFGNRKVGLEGWLEIIGPEHYRKSKTLAFLPLSLAQE